MGLLTDSLASGQTVYHNDQTHFPLFNNKDGVDPARAAGHTILPPANILPAGNDQMNSFTPFVILEQTKASFLFSMRLRGVDDKGETIKSWTFYLQAPPEDNGAVVWNGVSSFFTGSLAGGVVTSHYACMYQRDGNKAPTHDVAKTNCEHISSTGEKNGSKSNSSIAYWQTWDSAIVRLCV